MGGDLGTAALAAIGIALSPVPFLIAVALLDADRVPARAVSFVSGEALAVAGVAAGIVLLLGRSVDTEGGFGAFLAALEIGIGLLLGLLLVVHLRRTRGGDEPWGRLLERVDARAAFLGGLAMVVINPKNLALALAGSAAIVELGYSATGEVVSVATFTLASVSVLLALLLGVRAFPETARSILDRAHAFVAAHERPVGTVLLSVLAVYFTARGVLDLAA